MLSKWWKIFIIPFMALGLVLAAGCAGKQKPSVDVPCISACAIQAAGCAMSCIQPAQPDASAGEHTP